MYTVSFQAKKLLGGYIVLMYINNCFHRELPYLYSTSSGALWSAKMLLKNREI